jgi:ribosomal protein L37AE/L43A
MMSRPRRRNPDELPCPLCGETSPRSPTPGRNPVWCCRSCRTEFGFYIPATSPITVPRSAPEP